MPISPRPARAHEWKSIPDQFPILLLLVYEFIALAVYIAVPVLAFNWTGNGKSLSVIHSSSFYIYYLTGLAFLFCSLWVFGLRRDRRIARMFGVFSTSAALVLGCSPVVSTSLPLAILWGFAISVCAGALINLALIFPQEFSILGRIPSVRWAGFIPSIVLIILLGLKPSEIYSSNQPVGPLLFAFIYLAIACIFFTACLVLRWASASSTIAREQSRLILWGDIITLGFLGIWLLLRFTAPGFQFTDTLLLPILVFPVNVGYAILRYRLINTDYLISRAALYGTLTILTATSYGLIVSGLSLILKTILPGINPFIFGIIFFVLAVLFLPLRSWLQQKMDEAFVHGHAAYREKLQAFSRDLTQSMDMQATARLLRKYIEQSLDPAQMHIFVYNPLREQYLAVTDSQGLSTSDLRFEPNSSLVEALSNRRASLIFGETSTLPASLLDERPRLKLLGAQLFVPLPGRDHLIGWLAVSPRRSGDLYLDQDLTFLETLSDQAALAIERAQVVENLEQRVQEMNLLTRLSQGINITVSFDDILELIYAQIHQGFKTLDLRITLLDSFSNNLYHVFFLENDERYTDQENHPIPPGHGLERVVVSSRRPIVAEDYERECQSRGLISDMQGVFSWMGVPLNAGAETIGALCLANRDPAGVYTDEQINLLQAIADQVAGAIVKARLLQESEIRTHQLTSLNEIARGLTSNLELDTLLNQILINAVDILNCEAGSLLLVDHLTQELVFEVATGPVGATLKGERLPAGTGLVGKAVKTIQAIIANDVHHNPEWFERSDQETGFTTRDLLVVPMQVKGEVIGVIEVINRNDSMPFNQDDQQLLTAFTSQAAIAIENARLYTLTDQALAARVEELSVMQRIDRELNASLDIERTMRITLEWAMRRSKAEAGLVGVVETPGIRVMASQGYPDGLSTFKDTHLPLQIDILKNAIDVGQSQQLVLMEDGEYSGLLENAHSQVAVPIRRESQTIGIIFLESLSTELTNEETLAFLSRLSDHASTAITNAKLFDELESANQAKSEFVSFVSHELKNPMTSIRGFTDLIASRVVGPVNETQANFLSTIRSNVDRMTTLVSDLADISRIEAGRMRLDFGSVSVLDVLEEVTRSINQQVEAKNQKLVMDIASGNNLVWADRTRLIQILTNLVSNATKYSPEEGQITICAEPAQNVWDPAGTPQVIHFSVQDTGYGIASDDKEKIFQKFFRSEDKEIREAPGTGLGLNITRSLVEMQGGKIWFLSELHKGTIFHFTIPILEAT